MNKDIEIKAFPQENKAVLTGASESGKAFMDSEYKSIEVSVKGEDVNAIMKTLREKDLKFSFKL